MATVNGVIIVIVLCITVLAVMYNSLRYLHAGRKDCTWGHDWGKWEIAREGYASYPWGAGHPVTIQQRFCNRCGKMESDRIDHT